MNTNRSFSAIAAFLCCMIAFSLMSAPAQAATPIKVVLLAGQSNMDGRADPAGLPAALQSPQTDVLLYEGSLISLQPLGGEFGPEITFGRTVADAFPAENFALIKYASGGTNLYSDWAPGGPNYNTWISKVTAGLAALVADGYDPEIVAMCWTQGERDAKAGRTTAQYQADLNTFIAAMRSNYGSDMPFLLSRLSSGQTNIGATQLAEIRTAQENVAVADALSYMIDTDSFSLLGDNLHFDADGQIALGQAFGQTYIDQVPEPASLALLAFGGLLVARRRRKF